MIPLTKASDAKLWTNGWVNNGEADDLRRYCAHYHVTVMNSSFLHFCLWRIELWTTWYYNPQKTPYSSYSYSLWIEDAPADFKHWYRTNYETAFYVCFFDALFSRNGEILLDGQHGSTFLDFCVNGFSFRHIYFVKSVALIIIYHLGYSILYILSWAVTRPHVLALNCHGNNLIDFIKISPLCCWAISNQKHRLNVLNLVEVIWSVLSYSH